MTKNRGMRGKPCPTPFEYIAEDTNNFCTNLAMKLRKRAEYGYWQEIELDFYYTRILDELEELKIEIEKGDLEGIIEESIDVAAFCMMLWVNAKKETNP